MQLAGFDVDGHVVKRGYAGEALGDIVDGDERSHGNPYVWLPWGSSSNPAYYFTSRRRLSYQRANPKTTSVVAAAAPPRARFCPRIKASARANRARFRIVTATSPAP